MLVYQRVFQSRNWVSIKLAGFHATGFTHLYIQNLTFSYIYIHTEFVTKKDIIHLSLLSIYPKKDVTLW